MSGLVVETWLSRPEEGTPCKCGETPAVVCDRFLDGEWLPLCLACYVRSLGSDHTVRRADAPKPRVCDVEKDGAEVGGEVEIDPSLFVLLPWYDEASCVFRGVIVDGVLRLARDTDRASRLYLLDAMGLDS